MGFALHLACCVHLATSVVCRYIAQGTAVADFLNQFRVDWVQCSIVEGLGTSTGYPAECNDRGNESYEVEELI